MGEDKKDALRVSFDRKQPGTCKSGFCINLQENRLGKEKSL